MAGQPNPYPPPPGAPHYGFGPPGPPPPPPPPGEWQPAKPTSGKAIASLVCAIGGFVLFCPIALPVGLVLGILGISETGRNGTRSGRGLAIAGTVVSTLSIAGAVAVMTLFFAMAAEGGEEFNRRRIERVDTDVELIAARLKQYCAENRGTLHPGGPVLAKREPGKSEIGEASSNLPAGNEPQDPKRVTTTLTLADLVSTHELRGRSVGDYSLTVTGPTTATLVLDFHFVVDGEQRREYDFTDAAKGLWVQRYR